MREHPIVIMVFFQISIRLADLEDSESNQQTRNPGKKFGVECTLQETNISHLGKRKVIFKNALVGDNVSSQGRSLDL